MLTLLLHFESIRRLDVHVGGFLVLVVAAAEEAEAAAGAGVRSLCLIQVSYRHIIDGGGGARCAPFGAERAGLLPWWVTMNLKKKQCTL